MQRALRVGSSAGARPLFGASAFWQQQIVSPGVPVDEYTRRTLLGLVALMTMGALIGAVLFVGLYVTLGRP